MSAKDAVFQFNGNRSDKEQVRPYLAQYAELRAAGLSYNADFVGKIDGVAGSEHEDTAIYMLSCLWHVEGERETINATLSDGYQLIKAGKPNARSRYSRVLVYRPGHYVGGTGLINRYEDARVAFDTDGQPLAVIRKGRHNGYSVRGAEVYAK